MNEKFLILGVVGFIVSIFGIIVYFAIESQSEGKIQNEVLNLTKLQEINSETNDKIKNSTVIRDFKQFVQQRFDNIKQTNLTGVAISP